MLGLPEHGDKVKIWPMPGRKAQLDERPPDRLGGGRFLPKSGAEVEWSPFHHSQLLGGALLLHPPPCDKHDHGERGQDDCRHCGRDVKAAQQYNVDQAKGKKDAEAAAKAGLAKHPLELGLHPADVKPAAADSKPAADAK